MENFRNALVAIYITASIIIIIVNLATASLILYSPLLRQKSRCLLIVSIAMADLLMGSFVIPLLATTLIGSYTADCYTHVAVQVIGDHGIFLIVGWELITFNFLHIKENSARFPWKCLRLSFPKWLKQILLVTWPWLATVCVLVPLVVSNTPMKLLTSSEDVMCIMVLPHSTLIIVCFISLYLPFYLCVAALVTVVVCYSKGCHREQSTNLMGDINSNLSDEATEQRVEQASSPRRHPLAVTVPNIVYLVCYMPLIVHTWLHFSDTYTPMSVYGITVFGLLARSIILPMSWLVFQDIRHELRDSFQRLSRVFSMCARHSPPATCAAVSFSRLQESQPI